MGRKQIAVGTVVPPKLSPQEEIKAAAVAWAEFLYEEYCLEKQKRLISEEKGIRI
jgi:hypothetical protein